jgi:hypothetical protein
MQLMINILFWVIFIFLVFGGVLNIMNVVNPKNNNKELDIWGTFMIFVILYMGVFLYNYMFGGN